MTFENMTSAMLRDVDNDGIVNWWDLDSDNDMSPDSEEGYVRTNAFGLPLFLDPRVESEDDALIPCVSRCPSPAPDKDLNTTMLDTDNDGDTLCTILDAVSTLFVFMFQYPHILVVVSLLVHGNSFFGRIYSRFASVCVCAPAVLGIFTFIFAGIPDVVEGSIDTDSDGLRNFEDSDSDNDGILDIIECDNPVCPDTDKDSVPDYLDTDSDNDGSLVLCRFAPPFMCGHVVCACLCGRACIA